ncbi:uncharacterized protein KZ484_013470 [Pholidichthys leucotaenia]
MDYFGGENGCSGVNYDENAEINHFRIEQEEIEVLPDDVQELLVIKDEFLDPGLDQQGQLKEEQEDQEERWAGLEQQENISGFPFKVVTVKNENEEKTEFSLLYQNQTENYTQTSCKWIKTEPDEEDYGILEPARNSDQSIHLLPNTYENLSDSSETEVSDEHDWQEPLSDYQAQINNGGDSLKETRVPESCVTGDVGCHFTKKSFSCSACKIQFTHRQSLQRHIRNNPGGSCLFKKCFKQAVDSQVTETGEKLFPCEICGKTMKYQFNLKTHMRVHTDEKPFGCDVCGRRFRYLQNLKMHVGVHTEEKPYACDICGRRARHQNNLKKHMMVHTGEKPFSCDSCGKRFQRKVHLTMHMRVHTGEKPYGCDICSKKFSRKTHLRTHMTVHTGEKPYSCDVCGKKFSRKTHLESHITVHTGEKPFCCAVCDQEFTQPGSLNRHMRFHLG